MKRIWALAIVALLLPFVGHADTRAPMTPQDVIRLARAGAGDEVLLSQIDATHEVFTLTVQDILDLKAAGISDRVITYMINSGKDRSRPGAEGTLGGIDQDRYKNLPGEGAGPAEAGGDAEAADDEAAEYGDGQRSYDHGYGNSYDAASAFGYSSWSPFWNISLGWGFGGYYDPWYCGYWPAYWNYYSPFSCYSSYWHCPPYYAGWCDYGYPYRNDYANDNPRYGNGRYYKEGNRDLYNRGRSAAGTTVGGTYTSNDFGRSYKGTPISGTGTGGRGSYNNPGPGQGGRDYQRVAPVKPGYGNRGGGHPAYGQPGSRQGVGTPPSRDAGRTVKPSQPGYGTGVGPQGGSTPPPPPPPANGGQGGRTYKAPTPPPPPSSGNSSGRGSYSGQTSTPRQNGSAVGSSSGSSSRGTAPSPGAGRTMKKG